MAPLLVALLLIFGVVDTSAAQAVTAPPASVPARPQSPAGSAPASGQAPAQNPVPPTTAVPPPAAAPAVSLDYQVGPLDTLNVTVFGEPTLSGKFKVDNDGSFPFQYLGRVKADGLTVTAIEELLRKGLADGYLKNPQVSVEVDTYRSQNIYVLGEVRSPNKYSLAGNSTLMDAITQAGSVTTLAGHWVLIRHARQGAIGPATGDDTTADVRVNLDDLQSGKTASIAILDGDTVYVPRAERIYVNGQVRTAGAYPYEENMTVFTAIALAGGITEKGSNSRISVVRIENGQRKEVDVKQTDTLKAGDQVFVKPRRF